LELVYLVLGIAGLLAGTRLTIGAALAIARKYKLSEFFVGLIILSVGSDLPELAVAVDAGTKSLLIADASGVVVGTTIGSLVAQIGFVLGLAGLLVYLTLPRRFIVRHGAVLLGATAMLYLAAFDGVVSRVEALAMLILYLIYLVVVLGRDRLPENEPVGAVVRVPWPWTQLTAGLAVVMFCSELTVSSVVHLAQRFNISEAIISVLVIGLGTSLPELSISLGAILKRKVHLSVGNIIGSNIFDTLVPVAAAALIAPVAFDRGLLWFDLPYIFFLTVVVLALFTRVRGLQKTESAVILALYSGYVLVKLAQL
jgi:cation:H+ antiporter